MKKRHAVLLAAAAALTLVNYGPIRVQAQEDDIVILYTNDIHTYIDNELTNKETGEKSRGISYDNVAALKKEIEANETPNVLLVDAGDHLQGTIYGAIDEGQSIIELMNLTGYDLATVGNHELDYQISGLMNAIDAADFPYVSCNFMDLTTNEPVLDPYKIFEMGGKKIAFIGITTPSAYTSTSRKYFEDESGQQIYGFLNSSDGELLYEAVQESIDEVQAEGADYVIALSHLGVDPSSVPYTSREVIQNTSGLDAVIDGHSHTSIIHEDVTDEGGNTVYLTQTGCYFSSIGEMTIDADGNISTTLVSQYDESDELVNAARQTLIDEVNEQFNQVFAESDIELKATDENGNRIVRLMECSVGDYIADAYYYYINEVEDLDCDLAITNAGGVRAEIAPGDLTFMNMKNISPFGNVICLTKVTGQQIKDALEWSMRGTSGQLGSLEVGGFFQVAGVKFGVDSSILSTVQGAESRIWEGAPTGEYRVRDIQIYNKETGEYDPIDLEREYSIAGVNFNLRNNGDGCAMFEGSELVKDYIIEDYMANIVYARAFTDTDGDGLANISTQNSPLSNYEGYLLNYDSPYGSGRITIRDYSGESSSEAAAEVASEADTGSTEDASLTDTGSAAVEKEPENENTDPAKAEAGENEGQTDNTILVIAILAMVAAGFVLVRISNRR